MMAARAKRDRDPIEYHDVMIALSKAKAARLLLVAATSGGDYLQIPDARLSEKARTDALEWIASIADEALRDALDEAEAALRGSLTPDEARRQIGGGG